MNSIEISVASPQKLITVCSVISMRKLIKEYLEKKENFVLNGIGYPPKIISKILLMLRGLVSYGINFQ